MIPVIMLLVCTYLLVNTINIQTFKAKQVTTINIIEKQHTNTNVFFYSFKQFFLYN